MNNENNYIVDLKKYKKEFNDYLIELKNEMMNYDENLDNSPWLTLETRSSKLFNLIEKIKLCVNKIQDELEDDIIKKNYELITSIQKEKTEFLKNLNDINLFRNEQESKKFTEILKDLNEKYDKSGNEVKENKFVYHAGDLQITNSLCELCEHNNPDDKNKCIFYPDGKPDRIITNEVKCKYMDREI